MKCYTLSLVDSCLIGNHLWISLETLNIGQCKEVFFLFMHNNSTDKLNARDITQSNTIDYLSCHLAVTYILLNCTLCSYIFFL